MTEQQKHAPSSAGSEDILTKLDGAWDEDFKANLMHYCDLAAQEIRKLRAEAAAAHAEVVQTQDELGALLHAAEARARAPAQSSADPAVLRDALKNMMGAYDTPLSRRRFPPDEFMQAALESGRAALAAQPPAAPVGPCIHGFATGRCPICEDVKSAAPVEETRFHTDKDREYAAGLLEDLDDEQSNDFASRLNIVIQWFCKARVETVRRAARSSAEQPKDEQTCHDCGAREPCDEDCPSHVEPEPVQPSSAGTAKALDDLEIFIGEVDGSEAAEGGTIDGTEAIEALNALRAAFAQPQTACDDPLWPPRDMADLMDALARSADRHTNSYSETAHLCRDAALTIRLLFDALEAAVSWIGASDVQQAQDFKADMAKIDRALAHSRPQFGAGSTELPSHHQVQGEDI
jgi:hypothetical protein